MVFQFCDNCLQQESIIAVYEFHECILRLLLGFIDGLNWYSNSKPKIFS